MAENESKDDPSQEAISFVKQEIAYILENEASGIELHNIEILLCNADIGGPFNKAGFRTPYFDVDIVLPGEPTKNFVYGVMYSDAFDFRLLDMLSFDSISDNNEDIMKAYSTLVNYITDKKIHEACLSKVFNLWASIESTAPSETDIAYVLAVHLLAPLTTTGHCILDVHSKVWPETCPGGCGRTVKKGPTGIGSAEIWHGYADILLNHTIPVKIFTRADDEEKCSEFDEDNRGTSSEDDDTGSLHSLHMKMKKETDFPTERQTLSEIMAMTITNAFAQSKVNPFLSNYLIPCFGCSNNEIVIFAYDPQNDTLVNKANPITIMRKTIDSQCVLISSIVQIWLYINFAIFMHPSLSKRFKTKLESKFHHIFKISCFRQHAKCGVKEFPNQETIRRTNRVIIAERK